MKNYNESELNTLRTKFNELRLIINDSLTWSESNLKYDDRANALLMLKNSRKTINKLDENLFSKPAIALFGASQVGKSYLIKNLLSVSGKPFLIKNGDLEYDFLKQINPPGVGAESTGVVTRFSKDNNVIFEDFPIAVKLLSPKDVLLIICDSYFLDAKKIAEYPNFNDFNDFLTRVESQVFEGTNTSLLEDDILDCKDYFDNYFSKYSLLFDGLTRARYFERIGKIINRIPSSEWANVFSILWNNNTVLTSLFSTLVLNLSKIKFEKNIYLKFESVLRGGYEILDVKRLKEFNSESKEIEIKTSSNEVHLINLSIISSLIAELVFQVPAEIIGEKQFLLNSDLLDFPGARSRLAIDIKDISEELKPDMLLRGKVSYLFNKYSDNYNISSLLFCTNDKQLEVNELPSLLNNWIEKNVGRNEIERTHSIENNQIDPLFVVFTFYNNQLKFDTDNDKGFDDFNKFNYKWETRFERFFEGEIVTQARDWHLKWTKNKNIFDGFYLLRDFKYSDDIFYGFETDGLELGVVEERNEYYAELKKSFLNYRFVSKHFNNPELSWEMSSTLNNDGTKLIIENLNQISSNYSKIRNYESKYFNEKETVKSILKTHAHIDDLNELRRKSLRTTNDFQFAFDPIYSKNKNNFIELLSWFYLKPHDLYNLLNQHIVSNETSAENVLSSENQLLLTRHPALKNASTVQEMLEILKNDLFFDSIEDTEAFLLEKGIKLEVASSKKNLVNKGEYLILKIEDFWLENSTQNYNQNNLNLNKKYFDYLFEAFTKVYKNKGFRNKLLLIFNSVLNEIEQNRGKEEFLAETTAIVINGIINNFDFNNLIGDEKIEIVKLASVYKIDAPFLNDESIELTEDVIVKQFSDEKIDYSLIYMNKYIIWVNKLKVSDLISCGFVEYDERANNELLSIISKIN